MKENIPDFIAWLLNKENYPHQVQTVELVQTHISYILIAGDYVYKFKKPADFGFLNFVTLERRKYFCEEEVRLNRRLCPDIYLQAVTLYQDNDGYSWAERGSPQEYAVKMRRLSEEKMMNRVMGRGELKEQHIMKILEKLVPFYDRACGGSRVKEFGSVKAVSKTINDNFTETKPFVGGEALPEFRFTRIQQFAHDFLADDQLFNDRLQHGKVRECHGDLHSGNVCLEDDVAIFDCIEFNESLRCTDVAADLAFMAMDLDFHGMQGLSEFFIKTYVEMSGDEGVSRMLPFYKCYRAYVRGKIGLLTSVDEHIPLEERRKADSLAKRYFMLAEQYVEQEQIEKE